MHQANNITVRSLTHAARGFAATNIRQNRASENEVKALGGWNVGEGSYRACYERSVPLGALVAAANFNAQRLGEYRVTRESLSEFTCTSRDFELTKLFAQLLPPRSCR